MRIFRNERKPNFVWRRLQFFWLHTCCILSFYSPCSAPALSRKLTTEGPCNAYHQRAQLTEPKVNGTSPVVNKRNHQCPECDEKFPQLCLALAHLNRVHRGYKYNCNLCSRSYEYSADLRSHQRRKHGRKPTRTSRDKIELSSKCQHLCNFCENHFPTWKKLQRHIREVHFPKPTTYICQYCGKSFGHRRSMLRHIKYAHFEMQHICNHCGMSYKSPTSFKLHLNRMHPNEPVAGKMKREHSTGTNAASNEI